MIGVKLIGIRSIKVRKLIANNYSRLAIRSQFVYNPVYPEETGFIVRSAYEDVPISDLTLDQYTWLNFRNWQNKVATVCAITDRSYTYAKLRDHSAAFAIHLQQKLTMGLEVLAICLPNVPEYPIAVLGALEAGLRVTTINPIYTPDEISRQLLDSDAKLVVTTCEGFGIIKKACQLIQRDLEIICIRVNHCNESIPAGSIDFSEVADPSGLDFSSVKRCDMTCEDIALLPYSSGTTGLSKGVQLCHRNLTVQSDLIQMCKKTPAPTFVRPTTETFQEVLPCILPLFHIYGFVLNMITKLTIGCKVVTLPKFQPDTFLNMMAKYKGSVLHLVPPMVLFLGQYENLKKEHVESIRSIMCGAAPLGESDIERFTSRAPGVEFLQGYGLTEAAPVICLGWMGSNNSASTGEPAPNTHLKIVNPTDPTNTGLGPNQEGEILVRGPQTMKGYLNNSEATESMMIENGWMRTGDLAYYDEQNQLYITERLKELIKVKGFQVAPAELEHVLRDHPHVLEAAVVGIPHHINGEAPKAFVVTKPNVELTEKEIAAHVASKVAPFKRLVGGVKFVDSIPKNPSGKILRRLVREKYL